MRPATALSADGPLNFFNAVAVAANQDAAGHGVLVVLNDWIHGAASLTKTSTTAVQTFMSPLSGLVGTVAYGKVEFNRQPDRQAHERVGVLAGGRDGAAARGHHHGVREHGRRADRRRRRCRRQGLVIAGVGNGNLTKAAVDALAAQAKKGIVCVRASRVTIGRVERNVELDDDKLGFVASMDKNPQKSRVLLRLALLKARPVADVQRIFTSTDRRRLRAGFSRGVCVPDARARRSGAAGR